LWFGAVAKPRRRLRPAAGSRKAESRLPPGRARGPFPRLVGRRPPPREAAGVRWELALAAPPQGPERPARKLR